MRAVRVTSVDARSVGPSILATLPGNRRGIHVRGVTSVSTDDPEIPASPTPSGPVGPASTHVGKHRNIPVCILLEIVTIGIYGCFWVWHTQEDVKRRSGDGVGGWLGLVIYLVIGVVTVFLIPAEIKRMYEREGVTPPFSAWIGLWNLLPIVGQIVWFVKVQRALNRFWEREATAASDSQALPSPG